MDRNVNDRARIPEGNTRYSLDLARSGRRDLPISQMKDSLPAREGTTISVVNTEQVGLSWRPHHAEQRATVEDQPYEKSGNCQT